MDQQSFTIVERKARRPVYVTRNANDTPLQSQTQQNYRFDVRNHAIVAFQPNPRPVPVRETFSNRVQSGASQPGKNVVVEGGKNDFR